MNEVSKGGLLFALILLVIPAYPAANMDGKWAVWFLLLAIAGATFALGGREK